jgi:hypothetical protein
MTCKKAIPAIQLALVLVTLVIYSSCKPSDSRNQIFFTTRGVVLSTNDLNTLDWPKIAKEAGLTTIATHITPSRVAAFIQSSNGQKFLKECKELGLEVEHELHAINDLLPRDLFKEDSGMFRMNEEGRRVADYNLCVHSEKALKIVSENAVRFAKILTPTTGRYFYLIYDCKTMCHCPLCNQYSDSEQALILENTLIKALRKFDPKATLAHLAYYNTMVPPVKVKPEQGIFLEFAPIQRSYKSPLSDMNAHVESTGIPTISTHNQLLELLDENLRVFGKENAQVLEYWIDCSRFSKWAKPAKKLPWNKSVFLQDIEVYAKKGIRNITSFAVYIDAEYLQTYKDISFINEYGRGLKEYTGE